MVGNKMDNVYISALFSNYLTGTFIVRIYSVNEIILFPVAVLDKQILFTYVNQVYEP